MINPRPSNKVLIGIACVTLAGLGVTLDSIFYLRTNPVLKTPPPLLPASSDEALPLQNIRTTNNHHTTRGLAAVADFSDPRSVTPRNEFPLSQLAHSKVLVDRVILSEFPTTQLNGPYNGSVSEVKVYIEVLSYHEGISGWRTTLIEMLKLAQALSATFVEPCMINGRLKSCANVNDDYNGSPMGASAIFDLSWTQLAQPPLMVSYKMFQEAQHQKGREGLVNYFNICEDRGPCQLSGNTLSVQQWRMFKRENNLVHRLEQSVKNNNEVTVISMQGAWGGSAVLSLEKMVGMGAGTTSKVSLPLLTFHPQHIETIQQVLLVANIKDGFSLIHWRGERGPDMDYVKCAKYLLNTKRSITNKIATEGGNVDLKTPSFILMSSINENPEMMWGAAKDTLMTNTNNTAIEAIRLLEQNGMIKFDKLLNEAGIPLLDSGMLAVYDLILVSSANYFSTCATKGSRVERCHFPDLLACRLCNHLGKFAGLALAIRAESPEHRTGTSFGCWPQK